MAIDITAGDELSTALLSKLAPIAVQAATNEAARVTEGLAAAGTTLAARLDSVEAALAKSAAEAVPVLTEHFLSGVGAVSANIQHDQITQRHLALEVVAFLGVITTACVIAWLLGLPQAKSLGAWIAAPGVGGLFLAWLATNFKVPAALAIKK